MFSLAVRIWNGLSTIAPQISAENGRFVMAPMIGWPGRSQRTAHFVRFYQKVHLNEDDLQENFIKGSGPGGQKVNKNSNCVQLIHKPTGIIIKCHESRSLARNRVIAREILKEKLDLLYNGKESALAKTIAKIRKRKAQYARKRRKREENLAMGSQNIDNESSDSDNKKE